MLERVGSRRFRKEFEVEYEDVPIGTGSFGGKGRHFVELVHQVTASVEGYSLLTRDCGRKDGEIIRIVGESNGTERVISVIIGQK